tara:strand:+ start:720 stop:1718 length:999 start_codon:yes stop_codon:yes gene_type:complete
MQTKFAIGCLVQWYEIEIIGEYIESLKQSLNYYNDDELIVDFTLNINQNLEQLDEKQISIEEIVNKFTDMMDDLEAPHNNNYGLRWRINEDLITIADYRRDFNTKYCNRADVLIWGESDSLLPKPIFEVLDNLHQRNINENVYKYFTFFGTCKMWDESWKPIEHTKFTDKPFIDNDYKNWWNHHYTMNLEELNKINEDVEDLDVRLVKPYKFNGCGLVFSSDIIKGGANIPESVFFIHEDTAFMNHVQLMFGDSVPQFIIKNILLVHNRHHSKKRMYVLNEGDGSLKERRRTNDWYKVAGKLSELNAYNFYKQTKLYGWNDVWKELDNNNVI